MLVVCVVPNGTPTLNIATINNKPYEHIGRMAKSAFLVLKKIPPHANKLQIYIIQNISVLPINNAIPTILRNGIKFNKQKAMKNKIRDSFTTFHLHRKNVI